MAGVTRCAGIWKSYLPIAEVSGGRADADIGGPGTRTSRCDMNKYQDRIKDLTPLATLAPGEHETVAVRAPFTGESLADLPLAGPGDLDHAMEIARATQAEWASVPVKERVQVIRRFRDLLLDRGEDVLDVVQLETGKARRHAFEELRAHRGTDIDGSG